MTRRYQATCRCGTVCVPVPLRLVAVDWAQNHTDTFGEAHEVEVREVEFP